MCESRHGGWPKRFPFGAAEMAAGLRGQPPGGLTSMSAEVGNAGALPSGGLRR